MALTIEIIQNPPNKFGPKLSFREQCAIYALYHYHNIHQIRLAHAFGMDKRTISKLCDSNGPKYKRVHEELTRLGLRGMFDNYVDDDIAKKINATPLGMGSKPKGHLDGPSAAHKGKAGEHKIGERWFTILWHNDGWYFTCDLTGDDLNGRDLRIGADPFWTSNEAFEAIPKLI
jgi:hypothetical protein